MGVGYFACESAFSCNSFRWFTVLNFKIVWSPANEELNTEVDSENVWILVSDSLKKEEEEDEEKKGGNEKEEKQKQKKKQKQKEIMIMIKIIMIIKMMIIIIIIIM